MLCGILIQTHVANSHSAFGQVSWFSGKCVFSPCNLIIFEVRLLYSTHLIFVCWGYLFINSRLQPGAADIGLHKVISAGRGPLFFKNLTSAGSSQFFSAKSPLQPVEVTFFSHYGRFFSHYRRLQPVDKKNVCPQAEVGKNEKRGDFDANPYELWRTVSGKGDEATPLAAHPRKC